MKRWLPITAATTLFLMTGCNLKGKKVSPDEHGSQPARAASSYAEERAPIDPAGDALLASARRQADALTGVATDAGTDAGRRYFDGQTLKNGGFAVPDEDSAVMAGPGGARHVLARYTGSSRRTSDLRTAEPPAPDEASFPSGREALAAGAGKVLAQFDAFQHKMFAQAAPILSRAGWHAKARKGSAVAMHPTHVTVHHTEGPQTMSEADTIAAVRSVQHYHMVGRAAEGKDTWDDIGYHFLIDGSGRVAEGRPAETLGAHAGGANDDNIGISVMGNFNKQKPTAAQVESLTRLVSFLAIKYRQDPSRNGFLEPHRHYDNTDCPGKNMMSILAALHQKVDARTTELLARLGGAGSGDFVPVAVTDA